MTNRKQRVEEVAAALLGEFRLGQRVKTRGGAYGVITRKGLRYYDWGVQLEHTGAESMYLNSELKPA